VFVQTELAKKFNNKPCRGGSRAQEFPGGDRTLAHAGRRLPDMRQRPPLPGPGKKTAPIPKTGGCQGARPPGARDVHARSTARHRMPTIWRPTIIFRQLLERAARMYRQAEQLGVTEIGVVDRPARQGERQPRAPARCLYRAHAAGVANPHEMFQRHIVMVARWLERWRKCASPPPRRKRGQTPMMVRPSRRHPARIATRAGGGAAPDRTFPACSHTMKSACTICARDDAGGPVRWREDCVKPGAKALSCCCYQHWCDGREARASAPQRLASQGVACSGLEGIYYYISARC